jgi:hypothetical protein
MDTATALIALRTMAPALSTSWRALHRSFKKYLKGINKKQMHAGVPRDVQSFRATFLDFTAALKKIVK